MFEDFFSLFSGGVEHFSGPNFSNPKKKSRFSSLFPIVDGKIKFDSCSSINVFFFFLHQFCFLNFNLFQPLKTLEQFYFPASLNFLLFLSPNTFITISLTISFPFRTLLFIFSFPFPNSKINVHCLLIP
jgi:hypothetical protein